MKITFRFILFSALLGALAAGCSQQDFARPRRRRPYVIPKPAEARIGTDEEAAEIRAQRMAEVLGRWAQQKASEPMDYVVGPGDELSISVYALEAPDQTTIVKRNVTKEGIIALPWIGDVDVRQTTVRDIETRITQAYSGRFIKNPQVSVQVSSFRSVSVVVTGAIRNPGIYYLTDNRTSVLEVLAKAGGLTGEAADEVLIVQGEGVTDLLPADTNTPPSDKEVSEATQTAMLAGTNEVIEVNLRRLIDEGDLRLNVEITGGAIVTVKSAAQQYVYVLGYVQRPGAFTLQGGKQIDALRAVALAGGLSPTARAENSFLVRETAAGQSIIPINLSRVARGTSPTVYISPGDTLIVGSSAIAKLSEFVRPSASAGLSYTPGP